VNIISKYFSVKFYFDIYEKNIFLIK